MNILIIGLGSIARKHIEVLREQLPEPRLFALRSDKNSTKEEGVININTFSELPEPVDFAIISNPSALHFETITQALELNCPLFIEKPSLVSLQGSDNLLKVIEQRRTVTYVACNLRFHPCIAFVNKELEKKSRTINEINVYCGSYLPGWRPEQDFRKSYSANKDLGGGVHLDLIHEIDYLYWIFGQPLQTNRILKSNSSLQISAVDYAHYSLVFDTFVASVTLNYFRKDPRRTFEILFEDETWTVDLINNTIIDTEKKVIYCSDKTIKDTYREQMHYFLNCLENKINPMNSFQESLEVLKVVVGNE